MVQLADAGGYRHVKGGGPRVQAARERGNIEWYIDDRHHTASADEAHPDLLLLRANATVKDGAVTLQVGAQPDGAVFAGHHVMWTPAGVARVWDGVSTAAAHGDGAYNTHARTLSARCRTAPIRSPYLWWSLSAGRSPAGRTDDGWRNDAALVCGPLRGPP